jgi:FkbM family methyltransferase
MFSTSRSLFERINNANGLKLDYSSNKEGLAVLESIFQQREYADFFPFYQDSVIVDVGAHFGYFSLFAAINSGLNSKIFAVEPDRQNCDLLRKNLANCRLEKVIVSNHAIGHSNGKTNLYGGSSINKSLFSNYALGSGKVVGEVEVMSLSGFMESHQMQKIDFLKLDCEGAEYAIILQSDHEIWKQIHVVSMEFHDMKNPDLTANHLVHRLKDLDYDIVKFHYEPSNFGLNYGKIIAIKK